MRPPSSAILGMTLMAVAVVLISPRSRPVEGQETLKVDGLIESTTGGFKFPDRSVQRTTASVGPALTADTGQQACWSPAGATVSCLGTGQDGELQFGMSWPAPRFSAQGDGTVLDQLTGNTWLQDADCAGGVMTWDAALAWVAALNGGSTGCANYSAGTFSDWRLPNIRELLSLVDFGEKDPAVSATHPFANLKSAQYWSSTSYQANPVSAWWVSLDVGLASGNLKTNEYLVWPVRQGE